MLTLCKVNNNNVLECVVADWSEIVSFLPSWSRGTEVRILLPQLVEEVYNKASSNFE